MAERKAFALRISPDVWAAVQRCADDDFRSVNSEIEVLLREALKRRGFLRRSSKPEQEDQENKQ